MTTLRIKKGDSFRIEVTEYVDTGLTVVRNLTSCTVTSSWKHVDTGVYFDATVTITSATAGTYTVTATGAQTGALALGMWAADIHIAEGAEDGSSDTFYVFLEEAITNAA